MLIIVFEITGKNAITAADGEDVYRRIVEGLSADKIVTLQFSGVEIFATPFFNSAIGRLLNTFDPVVLNERLIIDGLSALGLEALHLVISNAKIYYALNERDRSLEDLSNTRALGGES